MKEAPVALEKKPGVFRWEVGVCGWRWMFCSVLLRVFWVKGGKGELKATK